MIFTIVLYSISGALAGLSPELWLFLSLKLISGGSLEALRVARQTYIAKAVPNHDRGKVMSTLGGSNRVGKFLGPLAGGWVAYYGSLRLAFVAAAGIAVISLVLILLCIPYEQPPGPSGADDDDNKPSGPPVAPRLGMATVLSENWRLFATAGVFSHLIQVLRESRNVILPLQAQALGLSTEEMGYVVSAGFFVDSEAGYEAKTEGKYDEPPIS